MSTPTTQTITHIYTTEEVSLSPFNGFIDTTGKVMERINSSVSGLVHLNSSTEQDLSGAQKVDFQNTGGVEVSGSTFTVSSTGGVNVSSSAGITTTVLTLPARTTDPN